jgi:hypothetical protein
MKEDGSGRIPFPLAVIVRRFAGHRGMTRVNRENQMTCSAVDSPGTTMFSVKLHQSY